MKKIFAVVCLICIYSGLISAQRVRIGNMEITIKENQNDTVVQIDVNDRTTSVTRNKDKENYDKDSHGKVKRSYHTSEGYMGLEFIVPDAGDDYLETIGGNSYQFNIGYRYTFHPARWYGIGFTVQYSFYNYRLRDASQTLTGVAADPYKEVFRSNNIGIGIFNRIYLAPGRSRRPSSNGLYLDFGVGGDWSYSRFYKTKTDMGDYSVNVKARNSYAFEPFNANAFAGVGFGCFEIFAHYRFTNVFNSDVIDKKLPPISVGFLFSF